MIARRTTPRRRSFAVDRRACRGCVLAAGLALALALGSARTPAEAAAGLAGLRRVSVSVELAHPLEPVAADDLVGLIEEALRGADPPLTIHEAAADRVRLTVAVGPVSATALRGFWLPFSGTYAIGSLRLGVERIVTMPGVARPFPAVVWQAERTATGPWSSGGAAVAQLLGEMLEELLDARRQAR
jgi:hypothetical protein